MSELTIPSPHDKAIFGYTPMPEWVKEFRPHQWDVIQQVTEAFKSVDVVFLQAPTGTGKSLIGESSRRIQGGNSIYACTTKALQDQFVNDYPYAKVIKGRSNYLTQSGMMDQFGNPAPKYFNYSAITCADCTFNPRTDNCRWCMDRNFCPYVVAKGRAERAELAVLNTSYLFTIVSKIGNSSGFLNRNLAIMDEADMLESELLSHVEVAVSNRRMALMGLEPPKKKTVEASWLEWVNDAAIPAVSRYLKSLPNPYDSTSTADDIKEYGSISELVAKLRNLAIELPHGGWIYDGYDKGDAIFRPIKVGKFGNQLLWPYADKFLLMSATILSADLMAEELGLNGSYELVDVPSTFPVENRQIHVVPIADMSFKNREQAWPNMVQGVSGVLRRHPDERILIHTVSYELAKYLYDNLDKGEHNRPILTYSTSRDKDGVLKEYKSKSNSVLLAPSMDRGIDLPDDMCRVQVVAKIPFPNIKDRRINARMWSPGGTAWYRVQTIRTLIQMTGRGVRSEDDWAATYILDSQFGTNLMKSKYLFPKWWSDALDFRFSPRKLLGG